MAHGFSVRGDAAVAVDRLGSGVVGGERQAAVAETVVAARTIRPQTILSAADLALKPGEVAGGLENPALLIGMETRLALAELESYRGNFLEALTILEEIAPALAEAEVLDLALRAYSALATVYLAIDEMAEAQEAVAFNFSFLSQKCKTAP